MDKKYMDFFDLAHRNLLFNIQITEKVTKSISSSILDGKMESKEYADNTFYIIHADYCDKTVEVKSNYLNETVISLLKEKGEYLDNEKIEILTDISKNNTLSNSVILNIDQDIEENIKLFQLLDVNWKLDTNIELEYSTIRIVNDLGVDIISSTVVKSFSASLSALQNGKLKYRSLHVLAGIGEDICYENHIRGLIDEVQLGSSEQEITSGKYKVLFKNTIMNTILNKLPSFINQKIVDNKTSFLEGKLDSKIFSDKVTIIEDPLSEKSVGYRIFDDEGTSTQYKEIVKDGVLKTYLVDQKTASQDHIFATGNYYGGISTRNMYLKSGDSSFSELVKKLDNGIIINERISQLSITSNDPSLSFQAYGLLVKNGKIVGGVKPVIVTTSYLDLFNHVCEIGNDFLIDNVSAHSPSMIVEDIDIAV